MLCIIQKSTPSFQEPAYLAFAALGSVSQVPSDCWPSSFLKLPQPIARLIRWQPCYGFQATLTTPVCIRLTNLETASENCQSFFALTRWSCPSSPVSITQLWSAGFAFPGCRCCHSGCWKGLASSLRTWQASASSGLPRFLSWMLLFASVFGLLKGSHFQIQVPDVS